MREKRREKSVEVSTDYIGEFDQQAARLDRYSSDAIYRVDLSTGKPECSSANEIIKYQVISLRMVNN